MQSLDYNSLHMIMSSLIKLSNIKIASSFLSTSVQILWVGSELAKDKAQDKYILTEILAFIYVLLSVVCSFLVSSFKVEKTVDQTKSCYFLITVTWQIKWATEIFLSSWPALRTDRKIAFNTDVIV